MKSKAGDIDPKIAEALLAVDADDPELAAVLKQLEMSNALRSKAYGSSKNIFGAIGEGLTGYTEGMKREEMSKLIGELSGRRKTGKKALYEGLDPPGVDFGVAPESAPTPVGFEGFSPDIPPQY